MQSREEKATIQKKQQQQLDTIIKSLPYPPNRTSSTHLRRQVHIPIQSNPIQSNPSIHPHNHNLNEISFKTSS
ncbi:hypothetical protein P280DRAFT_472516 [Massarina eburnea CBS 473.64]|uniref:Uncharacterized protein n=1 Tax=Massarina eburnea CBS 473.64 TaxID=1395130 RepID=A0A6A6RNA0_9PLEO|nr:hypothetical protein P280DRAFT_472516 [Massarina eburnea CBS 473.64]